MAEYHTKLSVHREDGEDDVLYIDSKAEHVHVSTMTNPPDGEYSDLTLDTVLDAIGTFAYEDTSSFLNNVTNDKQIKGKSTGTTSGHVVTWGSDGYTVSDSGYTIGASVPSNAKFTDTTYSNATTTSAGIVKLSTHVGDTDDDIAASAGALTKVYNVATEKVSSVTTGTTNGTIMVDDTSVSVKGLGTAAYTDSSAYATAAQGVKANSSVQSITISGSDVEYNQTGAVTLPAYPTSLPASDVYSWAKASTKPTYTLSELGAEASGAASTALASAKSYTDNKITELVGTSPENLDTIYELAEAIGSSEDTIELMQSAITGKVDKTDADTWAKTDVNVKSTPNSTDTIYLAGSTTATENTGTLSKSTSAYIKGDTLTVPNINGTATKASTATYAESVDMDAILVLSNTQPEKACIWMNITSTE